MTTELGVPGRLDRRGRAGRDDHDCRTPPEIELVDQDLSPIPGRQVTVAWREGRIVSSAEYDVVVVGAGNAGLVAALTAHEAGARVVVLEAAGHEERGGNSRFSGSIFRAVHGGLDSIKPILADPDESGLDRVYGRPVSARALHRRMAQHFTGTAPEAAGRDGRRPLLRDARSGCVTTASSGSSRPASCSIPASWTGFTTCRPVGRSGCVNEGVGLVAALFKAVEDAGIEVWYDAPAADLLLDGGLDGRRGPGPPAEIISTRCGVQVVLACGGFRGQSRDAAALPRSGLGSRPGSGHPLQHGHHAHPGPSRRGPAGRPLGRLPRQPPRCGPPSGRRPAANRQAVRYSFPYSLLINSDGHRFVDEGEDEVWLTYARTGGAILAQKGGMAYQVFDQKTIHLLEPRYSTGTPIEAATLEDLAAPARYPGRHPDRHGSRVQRGGGP